MGRVDETTSVPHLKKKKKKKKKKNKQTNKLYDKKNYLNKFLFCFIY